MVDFSGLEGKIVTLSNYAPAPYPGWDAINSRHQKLYELMQFRVTRPLSSTGKLFQPAMQRTPMERLDETKSTHHPGLRLVGTDGWSMEVRLGS